MGNELGVWLLYLNVNHARFQASLPPPLHLAALTYYLVLPLRLLLGLHLNSADLLNLSSVAFLPRRDATSIREKHRLCEYSPPPPPKKKKVFKVLKILTQKAVMMMMMTTIMMTAMMMMMIN